MIQASSKPSQTVMIGNIVLQLDKDYSLQVKKTVYENEPTTYEAKLTDTSGIAEAAVELIQNTAIAHLQKTGIW